MCLLINDSYCSQMLKSIHFELDHCTKLVSQMTSQITSAVRGGAVHFKVGCTKQDSQAERAKKNLVPPTFPNVGYKQANISTRLLSNILKFAVWLSH